MKISTPFIPLNTARLEQDFYLFAVRCQDMWLSWEEVQFYAALFDFPCVPEISGPQPGNDEKSWQRDFLALTNARGTFDPWDTQTCQPCTLEGIVSRIMMRFLSLTFRITSSSMCAKSMSKPTVHWKTALATGADGP